MTSKGVCRCILVAFIALRRVYSFFITPDGDCAVRGYFLFAEKNKSFSEKFLTFTGKIVRFTGRIRAVYIYKKKKTVSIYEWKCNYRKYERRTTNMKKKLLIGMAVIGASVAVLGGCGSSENTAKVESTTEVAEETTTEMVSQTITDDNSYSIELDESKRPKFDEETEKYYIQLEGKEVEYQSPIELRNNDDYLYEIFQNVFLDVAFYEHLIDEGELKMYNDEFSHTTIDGLNAFYTFKKHADKINDVYYDSYEYYIPFQENTLLLQLLCPHDDENRDEYIKFFDKVASSIDVYDLETATTTESSVVTKYDNWHELTKTYEDSDGYIVDLNVKISNWFTNEEQLSNAWNEISNGSEFDAFQPYDIVGSGKTIKYDSDEVLYAVGTLNVVNKTPGYENENRKVSIRISSDYYKIGAEVYTDEGIKYYTTGDTSTMIKGGMAQLCDSYNCSPILTGKDHNPHGYTNTWGTRPFIIALPINKTPKNPEGDVNPEEVKLGFGLQGTIDQGAGRPETINLSVE